MAQTNNEYELTVSQLKRVNKKVKLVGKRSCEGRPKDKGNELKPSDCAGSRRASQAATPDGRLNSKIKPKPNGHKVLKK